VAEIVKNDTHINSMDTIGRLLRRRAQQNPDHIFCRWKNAQISYRQLDQSADRVAHELHALGVRQQDRIAVMLPHHPDHIVTLLALFRMGAIVVPVNTHLRGDSLRYILEHSVPAAIIADNAYAEQLCSELPASAHPIWRATIPEDAPTGSSVLAYPDLQALIAGRPWEDKALPDDTVAICYTSGTTGPPKGVLITDKMCRCAARSSELLSGIQEGDTPLFWDPLYHLFGIEVVILALTRPITLAMVERFSASRFWRWAAEMGATHMHYVGGVIQLLLKQPPSAGDKKHNIRIAWGGGCPAELWTEFEERFGLKVHDSFGMTETSALNIINTEGVPGSVGRTLPYFEAKLVKASGDAASAGELGELLIRAAEPGLITPGYFRNPEATSDLLRDGWLHTGDLLSQDEQGRFYFYSRKKDCVRRRGENISAWEVESVINKHPQVVESALVPVRNEFGDEDLKIFVRLKPDGDLSAEELVAWCAGRMPRFQVPRFVAFIEDFPKTSTQRIQKFALSRATDDCWDADRQPDAAAGFHATSPRRGGGAPLLKESCNAVR